jgi:gamma-glutamyltranspeptidase/glutathione hydrolase
MAGDDDIEAGTLDESAPAFTTSSVAPTGMVACADRLASTAGAAVLKAGGTAADAAVAAGAVMAVTNPHMGDLGGDLFAVVHRPGEDVAAVCAAGRAGSGADALQMRCEDLTTVPPYGDIRAVTVPGCVDGWLALHDRYGRLSLAQVLEPAVTLAASGFPASPSLAASVGAVLQLAGAEDFTEAALLHRGKMPPGTTIRRPSVAATLASVATSGRKAFYLGPFGDGLLLLGAGWFHRQDLVVEAATWVEPLHLEAWGYQLWCPPPPSAAYLTLAGAAVAGRLELPDDPNDPLWTHLLVETARQTGRDRAQVLFDGADGASLLDEERLAAQAAAVDPERADLHGLGQPTGEDHRPVSGDTSAVCAVDADRMAVSLVQSNGSGWGARIAEPATGVFLHNRGTAFSLEPGHPAELQPGLRPPHTLSPTLVTHRDGTLKAVLGTMGGDAQPQILLQILARYLAAQASPGSAVEARRWILGDGGSATSEEGGALAVVLERDAPPSWHPGLVERGQQVRRSQVAPDHRFGHAQLIALHDGKLEGTADPRSLTGAVVGY